MPDHECRTPRAPNPSTVESDDERTSSARLDIRWWVTAVGAPVTNARAADAGANTSRAATATVPARTRIDMGPIGHSSAHGTEELESIRGRSESDVTLKFSAARPTIGK